MDIIRSAAIALIRLSLPRAEREWILGDIEEDFDRLAAERGRTAASRWLCAEILRTARGAPTLWRMARHSPRLEKGDPLMSALVQDVRYALRLLARAPGFTLTAVVTLTLGIGANATIFSVVRGVLLKPLPYAEPDRLVRVFEEAEHTPKFPVSPADFRDYRASLRLFDGLAAYMREDLQLAEGDRPEQLRAMQVTAGFFGLLGCRPVLGREFLPDEEIEGNDDAVILSDALWRRRFGGNPGVVGTTVRLSARVRRIVGVLPPGFQHVGGAFRSYAHGETVDVWSVRPVPRDDKPQYRFQHYFNVVGRLRNGVTPIQANEELRAVAVEVAKRYPGGNSPWTTRAIPLKAEIVGGAEPTLVVLLGAAEVILLLACVNVAGLLLGRSTARLREIGVRAALGATRTRLARQLLIESLVLAVAGGLAGVAVAYAAVRALARFGPADTPRLQMVTVDGSVLAYTAGATVLTALLFGLVPALQLARGGLSGTLKEGGRAGAGIPQQRLRRLLAGAQIALAFVLVVSGGLLLRSFLAVLQTDPGFNANGVVTAVVGLPPVRYTTPLAVAFYDRIAERVRALPGVKAAGFGSDLPWTGYDENSSFTIVGRTFPANQQPEARYHFIAPGFVRALEVPILAGRDVRAGDDAAAPPVVLVNASLARQYWPSSEAAVGARLNLWGSERAIAGVIGDVRDTPSDGAAEPAFYFPEAQMWYSQDMFLAVRTDGDPLAAVEPIRRILRELDPALPLASVALLDTVAGAAMATRQFTLWLVGAFGLAALFLAMVGVYGVMAQAVGQRTREFGVRQALGARPSDILRLVMTGGVTIGVAGLAAGIALGIAVTRLLASMLYRINPIDPVTFAGVAAALFAVAAAASYVPARRATQIDPAAALRSD